MDQDRRWQRYRLRTELCASLDGLDGRLHKNSLRALLFVSNVDRAPYRTCAVHGARRYDQTLPLRKRCLDTTLKLNLKFARYDEKEFVRIRVVMPAILSLKYR